jgi:hypothetical protein
VYRPVRCLFEFALLQMYRILDVHLLLYSCARGQGRLNRTERAIFHWSINRDLDRVIHITRHNVDDTFVLIELTTNVVDVLNILNNFHPSIKFTYEVEANRSLPFLDVRVTRSPERQTFETTISRKPTFTGLMTRWD